MHVPVKSAVISKVAILASFGAGRASVASKISLFVQFRLQLGRTYGRKCT